MKFTIITVTYDSASTLRDAIESVLTQRFVELEYIIVDGASKDNTVELIREYEPCFEGRLRWITEPDKGLYDAMNKGIAMATGDVIGILNSDDFYTNDTVLHNIAQAFMHDSELDATYGDIHFVKPNNLQKCVRYYSAKHFRPFLLRFGFMPPHPSFYCKKECYNRLGLYKLDYKIASDYDLLIRYLYINRIKAKYINLDVVTMRMGGASTENIKSRIILNKEIVAANKSYGVWTCMPLLMIKYIYKIFELK